MNANIVDTISMTKVDATNALGKLYLINARIMTIHMANKKKSINTYPEASLAKLKSP
jgi:hypothetical protein